MEKIQLAAGRISTVATKLVSVANLSNESGWKTLEAKMNSISWYRFIKRTEQNIYFIEVNCTVSCQIHEYNNKFIIGHKRCIHDLTTNSSIGHTNNYVR